MNNLPRVVTSVVVKDLRLKDEDKGLMSKDEDKDLKIGPRGRGSSRTRTFLGDNNTGCYLIATRLGIKPTTKF